MTYKITFLSVDDCLPPNKTKVMVIFNDDTISLAYYENGTFWENAGSKAEGLFNIKGWNKQNKETIKLCK